MWLSVISFALPSLPFPFKPVGITGHCVVSTFQVCLEDVMSVLKQMYDSLQGVPVCDSEM